ncbi:MAG: M48 family peptidase, partial [Spirochaetaceae bacterium]
MDAQAVMILVISFFLVDYIWETVLTVTNMRHMKTHAEDVPDFMEPGKNMETIRRSVEYSLVKSRFSILVSSFSAVFLLVLMALSFFGRIDSWLSGFNLGLYVHGIVYLFSMGLVFSLFSLPAGLFGQFVIEKRFGFSTMTPGLFFMDRFKGLVIGAVLGIPLLMVLFWFMETTGTWWWLFASGFFVIFQFVVSILYPTVIAPLFNKFHPLPEGELKQKISALMEKQGYKASGIFIMDGSRRSRHSNAYFTGMGRAKRIVLFDTLVQSMTPDEITAVFAHE